jgi:hypothetical protein
MGPLHLYVFINGLCNSINHCKFLISADDLRIFRGINSPHDCLLLQSSIDSVSNWCAANSVRLHIAKTRDVSYSRNTNVLSYEYQLCHATITRTSRIKNLGVSFDSKSNSHNHVDFVFSECINLLGLIRSIIFRYSSLNCLYVLNFTLVRSKLEYASVVWNPLTSTDANKHERIQQKFMSVCFYRFPPSSSL